MTVIYLPSACFLTSVTTLSDGDLANQADFAPLLIWRIQNKPPSSPVERAWHGYSGALAVYWTMLEAERKFRGLRDWRVTPYSEKDFSRTVGWNSSASLFPNARDAEIPAWINNEEIHKSHQRVLLHRDPEWYRQFGFRVTPSTKIIWPE